MKRQNEIHIFYIVKQMECFVIDPINQTRDLKVQNNLLFIRIVNYHKLLHDSLDTKH